MKKIFYSLYGVIIIGIIICIINSGIFNSKNSNAIAAGEKVYQKQCLICHGENGKGEGKNAGTAINNQRYLNAVSNKDIYNSVKFGREGTAMPSYGPRLSEDELNNVVAFIRNWQTQEIEFDVPKKITGDPLNGEKQYNISCINCHGDAGSGKPKMGTALSNPEYLKYTTDKQIWIGTAYGREDTRMGPSLKGLDGVRQLKKQEISDIVSYIRSIKVKQKSQNDYLEP
ncbi:cytochrome c oxidase cbb3-type subunit 3 [Bacillus niacini]|jgi:mono/diheme cytochrome c family protein|uniref:Cytochrome c oxidase cbb3-type subunit 3 n=1 Tax=Neobacillus niacini TaxID=86668 RepID=A0A852TAN6_9BACI|nr:c-type cytochrome [Neobacillus niacini]NYE04989.1 cytochrome c oxidase cbb3-type subunit 3 [Neobacillus niacini]